MRLKCIRNLVRVFSGSAVCAAAGVFLFPTAASAQTINRWTNSVSGKWETAANWSAGVPVSTDSANLITNANTKTVTIDATTTNAANFSTLTISNLTVSGPANNTNTLFLNNAGTNTPLRILNNFTISTGGNLLVGPSGKVRVDVDLTTSGTMTVTNGQLVATNASFSTLITGQATVSGASSTLTLDAFIINGGGTLTLRAGRLILQGPIVSRIGSSAGNTGTVWVTGGQLTVTNAETDIGLSGVGRMTVSNGTWLARDVAVGLNAGSAGTLTVAGGTNVINTSIVLGNFACTATGTVAVAAGRLFVTNAAVSAVLEVRNGTVTLSSGILIIDRLVITNACGHFLKTGGTLSITSTNLDANMDADGDGLPNGWETSFGRDPFSDTGCDGADSDCDGDGISNLAEFNAGTDPTNSASFPANSWISSSSGKWEIAGNWSLGAPSASDPYDVITNATTKTVTIDATTTNFPGTMTISNLILSGSAGTNTLSLANAGTNIPLCILKKLSITSGGVLTITNSALQVDGVSSDGFVVNGEVRMQNGAAVVVSNAAPTRGLEVGSSLGFGSTGTLRVAGGTLTVSTVLLVGAGNVASDGTVIMTGGEINLTNSTAFTPLELGARGVGRLTISNGVVRSKDSAVGGINGDFGTGVGTLIVAGPSAVFTSTGRLGIGLLTDGNSMTVANGGQVFSTLGIVGGFVSGEGGGIGSANTVTVSSASSLWNTDSLIVGDGGSNNVLIVTNSGSVLSSNVVVGGHPGAKGALMIAGGSMFVTNAAHTAVTEVRRGTLTLTTGGVFVTDSLVITNPSGSFVNNGGTFIITGQSQVDSGTNTISGGTTVLSSNFVIGSSANSTGIVNVTGGSLIITNGALGIGNSGTLTNGSGFGSMTVSNNATLTASTILLGSTAGGKGHLILGVGGTIKSAGSNSVLICNDFGEFGGNLPWSDSIMNCGYLRPGSYTLSNGTASCDDMYVGFDDTGTMTIAGGAMNILSQLTVGLLGSPTTSTGAVWITGGQLTMINEPAIIGNSGVGQMTLSNGTVTAATMIVGNGSNPGTLTVAGGVMTILSGLTVGDCGGGMTGMVTITGGNLFVTNAAHNATLNVRSGPLTLNGGQLNVDRFVMTNACAFFVRSGGTLIYGLAVLDPNLDADSDGIPNGWEQSHGLDPLNAADAGADNDGDGLTNLQEFLAGTDATNSVSSLRITAVTKEANDIRVTWTMGSGKTNALQRTAGASGSYSTNNFAAIFAVTNTIGTVTNYLDVGAASVGSTSRFYRVRLVP